MTKDDMKVWLEEKGFEKCSYEIFDGTTWFCRVDCGSSKDDLGQLDYWIDLTLRESSVRVVLSFIYEDESQDVLIPLKKMNVPYSSFAETGPQALFADLFQAAYDKLVKIAGKTASVGMTGDLWLKKPGKSTIGIIDRD